jgi:hypothetical protein
MLSMLSRNKNGPFLWKFESLLSLRGLVWSFSFLLRLWFPGSCPASEEDAVELPLAPGPLRLRGAFYTRPIRAKIEGARQLALIRLHRRPVLERSYGSRVSMPGTVICVRRGLRPARCLLDIEVPRPERPLPRSSAASVWPLWTAFLHPCQLLGNASFLPVCTSLVSFFLPALHNDRHRASLGPGSAAQQAT